MSRPYEQAPIATEIDRRSGCSVTYSDCATLDVQPHEATFRVVVADSKYEAVLVRIEQWDGTTTITDPFYTCADTATVPLHPKTTGLHISVERGQCPDGRQADASRGTIEVTFYGGRRSA